MESSIAGSELASDRLEEFKSETVTIHRHSTRFPLLSYLLSFSLDFFFFFYFYFFFLSRFLSLPSNVFPRPPPLPSPRSSLLSLSLAAALFPLLPHHGFARRLSAFLFSSSLGPLPARPSVAS